LRFAGRYLYQVNTQREEGIMVDKQTEADKAQAMREYREKHEAAMRHGWREMRLCPLPKSPNQNGEVRRRGSAF
jgi:hypothetical protein